MGILKSKAVTILLRLVVIGLVSFFFAQNLRLVWNKASIYEGYEIRVEPGPLTLSMVFLLIHFGFLTASWRKALAIVGGRLSWQQGFKILALSQFARYVPGSIWNYVGQVYLCEQEGISKSQTLVSVALQTAAILATGPFLFVLCLSFWPTLGANERILALLTSFLILSVIFLSITFNKLLKLGIGRLVGTQVDVAPSRRGLLGLVAYCLGSWVAVGLGLHFFIRSIYSLSAANIPIVVGTYAISWTAGFLAVVVPTGLGVREGVLAFLFKFYLPLPVAVLVALFFRLWQCVRELLILGIALGWDAAPKRLGWLAGLLKLG